MHSSPSKVISNGGGNSGVLVGSGNGVGGGSVGGNGVEVGAGCEVVQAETSISTINRTVFSSLFILLMEKLNLG